MRRPLIFVAFTAFLMMLGLSVLFPVLPFYIRWLDLTELQAGVLLSIYAGISVVVSPLWGRFSERFGRKPAIIIGLLGFAGGFLLFGLGSTFNQLLGARILGGLFAAAAIPAIFAYVADVSSSEDRSVAMGVVGASIGLGIVLGPVFGGALAPLGLRVPFYASAGIGGGAAVLAWLFLPESLGAQEGETSRRRLRFRPEWTPFLAYGFLISAGRMGFESTIGFLIDDRLSGGPQSVGVILGVIGLVGVAIQGGGLRYLTRRFSDHGLMLTGTVLIGIGLAGIGLASGWAGLAVAGIGLAAGYALATPTFTARLSRVAEGAQGQAQGLSHASQSLGRVTGPLAFTFLYQVYGGVVTYFSAAVLAVFALGLAWWWLPALSGAHLSASGDPGEAP